jgi:hypothetical protein
VGGGLRERIRLLGKQREGEEGLEEDHDFIVAGRKINDVPARRPCPAARGLNGPLS